MMLSVKYGWLEDYIYAKQTGQKHRHTIDGVDARGKSPGGRLLLLLHTLLQVGTSVTNFPEHARERPPS